MIKIENQTLAAEVMKNVFKDRYADCVFANKAELVSAHGIPGPVWMLKGIIGWTQVVFLWEVLSKYACICPVQLSYHKLSPKDYAYKIVDRNGRRGKIVTADDEVAIVWE